MLKIAIQGIETSFHEVAAQKHFGKDIQSVACLTFTELCESLKSIALVCLFLLKM